MNGNDDVPAWMPSASPVPRAQLVKQPPPAPSGDDYAASASVTPAPAPPLPTLTPGAGEDQSTDTTAMPPSGTPSPVVMPTESGYTTIPTLGPMVMPTESGHPLPITTETRADINGKAAAPVRYNNPSGMWEGPSSRKFGAATYGVLADGNHIASFDSPEQGAAAQFDLMNSKHYLNRKLSDVIGEWSGGTGGSKNVANYVKTLGLPSDTVISPELLRSAAGIALAKAQAHWESGGQFKMTDEQWQTAHNLAFPGATPAAQTDSDDTTDYTGPNLGGSLGAVNA